MRKILFAASILIHLTVTLIFPTKILAAACAGTCKALCRQTEDYADGTCPDQDRPQCCVPRTSSSNTVGCDDDINKGINTAIGCIPITDQNALVGFILRWAIGVGGGIAFILILVAGFQIMTSRGDPKRLQAGQELLTSAIGGLILLIFSVFILKFIGIDILQLGPTFGTTQ